MFFRWNGGIVGDNVLALISYDWMAAAVTGPEDIPVISVGGVLLCVLGYVCEMSGSLGEFLHLREDSDVPVYVVFDYEGGGESFVYDAADGV